MGEEINQIFRPMAAYFSILKIPKSATSGRTRSRPHLYLLSEPDWHTQVEDVYLANSLIHQIHSPLPHLDLPIKTIA